MNALFLKKPRGAIEMKRLLNHSACRGSWYNNLTALAKSKISTHKRNLYHKLRISKEIRPAAGASAAAQGARDYGIMNPSIMLAALPSGRVH